MEPHRLHRRSERGIPPRLGQRKAGGVSRAERRHGRDGNDLTAERRYAAMRSVEMKNRCLLYYGNPVGYRTEQGVVADSMFRREELEDWLARNGAAVRWRTASMTSLQRWIPEGSRQRASPKSCRIWQLGPSAPAAMRFIGLDRMSGEYGGPDLTRYQAVFDGTVSTNSLDGIWEAFCRRSLGSDGPAAGHLRPCRTLRRFRQRVLLCGPHSYRPRPTESPGAGIRHDHDPVTQERKSHLFFIFRKGGTHHGKSADHK